MVESASGVEEAGPAGTRIAPPSGTVDGAGKLRVSDAIAALASDERTVLITDHDLTIRDCGRLFGYSDHARKFAIVSTFHLNDGHGSLRRRLHNALAHELGHLDGWAHCSDPRCVMHPSTVAADLDTRPDTTCGACPHRDKWWSSQIARTAAAVLSLLLMIVGTNSALSLLLPEFDAPFT
jgi:hypothetical protein